MDEAMSKSMEWRVHRAFRLIASGCTVTMLSLQEMEDIVLRALRGEFDEPAPVTMGPCTYGGCTLTMGHTGAHYVAPLKK